MALSDPEMMAAIAVTRFGLGARPQELATAQRGPQAWLKAQITDGPAGRPPGDLPDGATRLATFRNAQQQRRMQDAAPDPDAQRRERQARVLAGATGQPMEQVQALVNLADASGLQQETVARAELAASTEAPFRERWALFWANHFTVSAIKAQSAPLAGPFEREVIRAGAFGGFADLLLASSTHPGMLLYLDQAQSVGPNSPAAVRRQGRSGANTAGLNENLAREILELHTVGVEAGYTQNDVTELAKAMTGWTVGAANDGERFGRFVFRPATHEPGPRTVMGKRYRDTGGEQALDILRDLAVHPATARHIARKLATHFVADTPPPELVSKLERRFMDTSGDLAAVAHALVEAEEAWTPEAAKLKTPYELIISAHRALGVAPARPPQIVQPLTQMGQPAFRAPSPKGWSEDAGTWAAPDALIKRLAWAEGFAAQVSRGPREPLQVARDALGERLSPRTASAIISAESRDEALTILFMSPEFQRR